MKEMPATLKHFSIFVPVTATLALLGTSASREPWRLASRFSLARLGGYQELDTPKSGLTMDLKPSYLGPLGVLGSNLSTLKASVDTLLINK